MSYRLMELDWPDFGTAERIPSIGLEEYRARLRMLREKMRARSLTHVVVYGDREHFANLAYLTGFDPRFEESVLIVGHEGHPLILVGNECEAYVKMSPLWGADELEIERYQPFSLLNQPRGSSRQLREIFGGMGIGKSAVIGCVGWKYFAETEHETGWYALEIPAFIVDTLRDLSSTENVYNVTDLLMHPTYGMRANCSAAEIAYFEYANGVASEAMRRMLFQVRDGMTDFELLSRAALNGLPFSCHPTLVTGATHAYGLAGPVGSVIRRGEPLATNIGIWGANICRAGWVAGEANDLPLAARDYVENFAGIYYEVMGEWFQNLRLNTLGGTLAQLVNDRLPPKKFGIFLNPGHLIHLDEWVSSPIYPNSTEKLHSGMVLQVDVIPSSSVYFSTRMEDGVALADSVLRSRLAALYPDCYSRIQARRVFIQNGLGIPLAEEVLPLSNMTGIVSPFLLRPNLIFTLA